MGTDLTPLYRQLLKASVHKGDFINSVHLEGRLKTQGKFYRICKKRKESQSFKNVCIRRILSVVTVPCEMLSSLVRVTFAGAAA